MALGSLALLLPEWVPEQNNFNFGWWIWHGFYWGAGIGKTLDLPQLESPEYLLKVNLKPFSVLGASPVVVRASPQKYQRCFPLGLQIALTLDSFALQIAVLKTRKGGACLEKFHSDAPGFWWVGWPGDFNQSASTTITGPMHSTAMHCATGLRCTPLF